MAGVSRDYATPHRRFAGLIEALHTQSGQRIVVLVDEYDRPITDALDDPALAKANRSFLRGVYGVVKDADALIKFSFFTGVTKFSKVGVFSTLNNLIDITLDPRCAAICGYTGRDVDTVFAAELGGLDRPAVRAWYTATAGWANTASTTRGQIKQKRYADKHRRPGESTWLVGVEFSAAERNIVRFDVAAA